MNREKWIKQLFVGKVNEIIGTEKTTQLLRDATIAIEEILSKLPKAEYCDCEAHSYYDWEMEENKCYQCEKIIYEYDKYHQYEHLPTTMKEKNTTAVQWLAGRIPEWQKMSLPGTRLNYTALFDHALAMEREQIADAFQTGMNAGAVSSRINVYEYIWSKVFPNEELNYDDFYDWSRENAILSLELALEYCDQNGF